MTDETLNARVLGVIAKQAGYRAGEIKLESRFIDDLDCDSLDAIEIVMALEEEFEVRIDDDEIDAITTVAEAVAFMKLKTAIRA